MRRIAALAVGLLLAGSAAGDEVRLAAYGAQKTFDFRILAADGTYVTTATDGGTDVTLTCDDATPATATNDFADEGSHYSIVITATELQCARLVVDVADAIANGFMVETYGNAIATHPVFPANVTQWLGTAAATPTTAGVPEVDVTFGEGTDFTNQIDARLDARLAAIRLDELLAADSDIDGAAPPTVGSVFHELMSGSTGSFTFDQTTDSAEATRNFVLGPTIVGRTLDVTATGAAGIDWGNVENPTTTVGLTNTTVDLTPGAVDDTAINSAAELQAAAAAALNAEDGANFTLVQLASAGRNALLLDQGTPAPTTIATLASQTSFTLNAGSSDDNAYNGYGIIIRDASATAQTALGCVRDYTGSTKTVTLLADPAIFTMATSDNVTLQPSFCDAQVQQDLLDTAILTCTVDTANFAGSSTTFACDLTDSAGVAVTTNIATDELKGKPFRVVTGAQKYEERYVFDTTWDGTNNELQVTIAASYPFSATLANGVIVVLE